MIEKLHQETLEQGFPNWVKWSPLELLQKFKGPYAVKGPHEGHEFII